MILAPHSRCQLICYCKEVHEQHLYIQEKMHFVGQSNDPENEYKRVFTVKDNLL